jgi:molybdenum cofactor guanylyltransferase
LRIFGVILAGGEGRRMGGVDKALVRLAGRPLIAHVLDRLEPQVDRVLISANGDPARFAASAVRSWPMPRRRGPFGRPFRPDRRRIDGGHACRLHPRRHALFARRPGASASAGRGRLARRSGLAADATGDHPATALWPVGLAPALAAFLAEGQAKVTRFTAAHGATGAA